MRFHLKMSVALLSSVAAANLSTGAMAQVAADAYARPAAYKVHVEHNRRIPMRDGVTLSADIYLPDSAERFPALLLRTPYSNNSPDDIETSTWFAARGYVVVNEDVRGRYDSDGVFYPYEHEADDGYDTDEWIVRQPWSNGQLGTMGGSYLGYTQLAQAVRGNTHLRAMSADFTSTDVYDGWAYVDGAFLLGFALPWGATTIDGRTIQAGSYDWPSIFRHLPLSTADDAAGHQNQPYRDWLSHPQRVDPYWQSISHESEVGRIRAPWLSIGGWYDIFLRGTLRDDVAVRRAGGDAARNKRLIIGPWTHAKAGGTRYNDLSLPPAGPGRRIDFGPAAEAQWRTYYLRWHDHWLKGIDNGVAEEAPIRLFIMGENRWREEREWPLARTRYTRYFLSSTGHANSDSGGGVLGLRAGTGASFDSFTYDPDDPVPTLGGNLCCSSVPSGARDHRALERRADVLVYSTPVLSRPLEVTGPISVRIHAASSAPDTDWVARLVDVHPDGFVQNLQDGIVRARYRRGKLAPPSLLEPGRIYAYDIDLWATSNVFLPGHRLRLEITSSNFPRFDRNLNTGEDPATGTRMQKARQVIYHSARYPSYILLPIIPRSTLR
jgi:putative CocE/NonD family hydrolase